MDNTDHAILRRLRQGLPLGPGPFRDIAGQLGLDEQELLGRIRNMMDEGIIRRFRARIDQRKMGITANALVAWRAHPPVDAAGQILAAAPGVSHCYEREPVEGIWDFTLYTVHHGRSREQVLDEVSGLSRMAGLPEYRVLFSTRQFKQVPAAWMPEAEGG